MPTFQVLKIKPLSGKARESGRDYSMLIVGGIFTDDDGVIEMGEITFMQGQDKPLPMLAPGQKYTPILGATVRDGKMKFEITSLKPLPAAAARAAA
jgi:hypothetical protein